MSNKLIDCSCKTEIIGIINGQSYMANTYNYNKLDYIVCVNGHELKFSNGPKIKPYFSHKHLYDLYGNDMTDWHKHWQSQFENTESRYVKIMDQTKDRYADVVLSDTHIIEFQNSKISISEIKARKYDYQLHKTNIIWVINGSSDVILKYSTNGEYLIFKSNPWKYESFIDYDFVYIHINDRLCIFTPKDVGLGKMVSTKSFSEYEWIHCMNNKIFYDIRLAKFNLTIKQQGDLTVSQ